MNDLANPYPGLRPFRESESHLFFGRGEQIDALLAQLGRSRFVAVVGASGSGKSSLVKAGLIPALHSGFSSRPNSLYLVATMRPGAKPVRNLAYALADPNVLGREDAERETTAAQIEAQLRRSGLGLADMARRNASLADARLLIVVDQFEEIFRYNAASDSARDDEPDDFVQLVVNATQELDVPVDVVLTMRSDFLGECARFQSLPEAINRGMYLLPRLTRAQLEKAITGPAAVRGGSITPRLVQRLLNDAGTNPDALPILQHALMRTWDLSVEDIDTGSTGGDAA